ncbi:MAG: hypothetical protein UY70_C0004G0019 [Candidatus Kaiserbacteria bacterium GW2011_GWB1_52_6]|uniref:Uncharacterized protein n=3 Tax=Candidatus Kaiseribacteriota TaxID=1752734 RepID=A0A0G1ZQ04_9BACT|nr:MAG: hypothetical protein UY67_C0020G0018 [Candidatus Kaiserbacteria bacterium GW2011_GWA2_52_12]KKW28035.1 MAG: hypothetical protein UY70_C0004G0019 [Candidatus Kaiserbacteria bacterium GW2011_GWB1_52_6]KKW30292.1 MAG: hypothetical protein UY74_C0045G0008 [Candidatus Kaiserbacteria bacterium GW2011_GWC2_52_8b]
MKWMILFVVLYTTLGGSEQQALFRGDETYASEDACKANLDGAALQFLDDLVNRKISLPQEAYEVGGSVGLKCTPETTL